MTGLRSCAALAAAAALAACAALEAPGEAVRRAPAFDLMGRVAVNYDGRAFSSGVRWEHLERRDEMWLLTPTGQAVARIEADAAGATLTAADGKQYHAGDVESLTRRALGWELPLARLGWWVQGIAAPEVGAGGEVRDVHGRLAQLAQDGWRLTFTHHPPGEHGGRLQRLELERDAHRIRLVVDSWRRDEGAP